MPDTAIPVYQTINEKGEATAEIEAVIKALGLKLPTGFNTEPATNPKSVIQWDGGETPESLEDYIIGTGRGTAGAELFLAGLSNEGKEPASLGLKGYGNGLPAGAGKIVAAVASVARTIITSGEQSSFLQLLESGRWRCNFGRSTWEWAGAGVISNLLSVSHGLGGPPLIALITSVTSPNVTWNALNFTSTVFQTFGGAAIGGIPPAGTRVEFSWFAIG